ncbi:MAG: ribonuclease P protein component [Rhodospirillaceae bacterium]|nr:ribonuclease P protein component [Rhodospirillaceae bacterium]
MARDTELAEIKIRGRLWNTLPKRADFLRISAAGVRRVTPGFILQAAPKGDAETRVRVGFTASRKVGNAVARNRVKRRLRALADKVMPEAADPSRDYVFIGRGEALKIAFAAMERDLRKALAKLAGMSS